jgi:hypothetical protein
VSNTHPVTLQSISPPTNLVRGGGGSGGGGGGGAAIGGFRQSHTEPLPGVGGAGSAELTVDQILRQVLGAGALE